MPINSDIEIRNAKPKDKEYFIADKGGLSLLIKPNGSKLWIFRYTSPITLKRRKSSLGVYPALSLSKARKQRDAYKQLIADGIDPIDQEREDRQRVEAEQDGRFDRVVDEWLKMQAKELAKSTITRKIGQFETDVKPFFKGRVIASIKHPEIIKLLELKAKRSPESASRLFNYLNDLWKFATMRGYCDFNIIANLDRKYIIPPRRAKHYPKIVDPAILSELTNAIYSYKGDYSTRNALRLVLHLPLRAENLVSLKWEYVDFEAKMLTIPRHLMKSKDPNLPDFKMPLTPQVIEILNEQKLFTGEIYVFKTSGYKDTPINPETPNRALQRMGFNDESRGRKIRLHGFRGTFRSLADSHQKEHGVSFEAREKALDHNEKNAVVRAYTNMADYTSELKILMQWWSDFIVSMLDE